jgi:alpha-1,3-glucosyltransferase
MSGTFRRSHVLSVLLPASLLLRYAVSLHGYSGEGNAEGRRREDGTPMFGDYEAQRHWMELTLHLPPADWYRETADNDLLYWGLDYPPLTAWHSKVCGRILQAVEPASVALRSSRGYESVLSRLVMRLMVMASDLLFFYTGVLAAAEALDPLPRIELLALGGGSDSIWDHARLRVVVMAVMSPALVIIDHGHFQFNCVCLGLAAWAVAMLARGHANISQGDRRGEVGGSRLAWSDLTGSAIFVMAMCFKQIALYYAPAFFFYLLGRCLQGRGILRRAKDVGWLALVVIGSFTLCLYPWVMSVSGLFQVVHRVFPIGRGLFEDKVANFWCATAPVLRIRQWLRGDVLVFVSLGATVCMLLPSGIDVMRRPSPRRFLYALLNSSLAFFLFAYQVHEKSILFALLPLSLLGSHERGLAEVAVLLNQVGLSSMYPLLRRDRLVVPYILMSTLITLLPSLLKVLSCPSGAPWPASELGGFVSGGASCWHRWRGGLLQGLFLGGALGLHLAEVWIPPPAKYPDIHVLLLMVFSACWLLALFVAANLLQIFRCDDAEGADEARRTGDGSGGAGSEGEAAVGARGNGVCSRTTVTRSKAKSS